MHEVGRERRMEGGKDLSTLLRIHQFHNSEFISYFVGVALEFVCGAFAVVALGCWVQVGR